MLLLKKSLIQKRYENMKTLRMISTKEIAEKLYQNDNKNSISICHVKQLSLKSNPTEVL